MNWIKKNVYPHEYAVYKHVRALNIVNTPEIIAYDRENHVLTMQRINGMNLSDMFGEKASDIEAELFDQVRQIIQTLWSSGIGYPDITGYNFIRSEDDGKLYIIDFEHAYVMDPFVQTFLSGKNAWNPEYA